jgi:hypothetical protein
MLFLEVLGENMQMPQTVNAHCGMISSRSLRENLKQTSKKLSEGILFVSK